MVAREQVEGATRVNGEQGGNHQGHCRWRSLCRYGGIIEAANDLQICGLDAVLAVITVVHPTDKLLVAQVLLPQPLFQGLEVLTQRGTVQATFAQHLLQHFLPRLGSALLHQFSGNGRRCDFWLLWAS